MGKYGEGIYEDTGCALYSKCLECPFPDCIADKIPSLLITIKKAEARELAEQGLSKVEIARKLGVSEKTVKRYLDRTS